jgi:Amt family ammonium transporter
MNGANVSNTYSLAFVAFQATFAIITVALISGAIADRAKFGAWMVFAGVWATLVYFPVASWVFNFAVNAKGVVTDGGWSVFGLGVNDFAGGTAVHINAGAAGLALALVLGKRVGFAKGMNAPHNVPLTLLGAALLWFGWFGFNAGSALEANGSAALAFMNTYLATACAVLSWMGVEWLVKGKPSMLGAASGAVAGLVAITPAAGNVGIPGAFIIGLGVGVVCFWGVTGLKKMIRADDALDVFGVHALGGCFGALTTGIFNAPSLGGPGSVQDWVTGKVGYPGIWAQFVIQAKAVAIVAVWTAVVACIAFGVLKFVMGIRVSEEEEREGLDLSSHGEKAYGH